MESLDSRLKRIEQRLSSIEKFIAENIGSKPKDLSVRLGRVSNPVDVSVEYKYNYTSDFDPTKMVKAPIHQIDNTAFNEKKFTGVHEDTLVTAVSGVLLIVALFFLGKFLIDASWLNSKSLIGLGAVLGLGFVIGGYSLRNAMTSGIHYLPIVGIVLLYVTLFGASNYYAIIPKNIGLAGVLLVSWMALYVQREIQLEIYQIIAVVGAYVVPLYISFEADLVFTNFYYLVVSLSFMLVAVQYRLSTLALLGAYFSIFVCGISDYFDNDYMNKVLFTLGHFVIYASAYVLMAIRSTEPVNRIYTYCFFPFVLLFYIFEYYYLGQISRSWQLGFGAAFAALFVGLYQIVKTYSVNQEDKLTQTMLLGCAVAVFSHLIFFIALPIKLRPIGLILAGLAILKTSEHWLKNNNLLEKIITYFFLLLIGVSGFEVMVAQYQSQQTVYAINGLIYALILFYVAYFENKISNLKVNSVLVSSLAHLFIASTLYGFLKDKSILTIMISLLSYSVVAIGSVYYLRHLNKEEAVETEVSPPANSA